MERKIKIHSIRYNLVMNVILRLSGVLFPLITFPYIARVLLPAANGKIAFATSVINYFTLFAGLGIPTYGIRACAKNRDNKDALSKTVQELLIINSFLVVISYFVFIITLFVIPEFKSEYRLLLIQSTAIFLSSFGVEWFYQAIEQYDYITVRNIAFKIISLILMFIFVHSPDDYLIYGSIYVLGTVGSNIINMARLPKYIEIKRLSGYDLKQHFKPIVLLFLYNAATQIYTNLDTVMLGFISGNVEVGFYNVSIKIKNVLCSILVAIGAVTLPRISNYLKKGEEKYFLDLVEKSFVVILFFAFPMVAYFLIETRSTVLFLAGAEYLKSSASMIVIMPCVLFVGLSSITAWQMLIPMGKDKATIIAALLGGGIDFILNLLLIPSFGAAGAALGTLVAEIVVLLVEAFFLREYIRKTFPIKTFIKTFIGTILAGVVTVVIINRISNVNSLIELIISFCLFGLLYLGIEICMKNEFLYEMLIPMIKTKIRKGA